MELLKRGTTAEDKNPVFRYFRFPVDTILDVYYVINNS